MSCSPILVNFFENSVIQIVRTQVLHIGITVFTEPVNRYNKF